MDVCGFVCQSCNFRLLLRDLQVNTNLLEAFKDGATHVEITCPECGIQHSYAPNDLNLFLPGGKQVKIGKRNRRAA